MSLVWRDGRLRPGDAQPGSFPAGAALFETVALRQGRVECLDDHLARLAAGLARLGLSPGPLAGGDLPSWRAGVRALGATDAILRLVVGPGFEELGARPLLPSAPDFRLRNLRTVRDEPEWMPRPKSAPWATSLAATRELRLLGEPAGAEGVQLDARGFVCEGSRSSLAWVRAGRLEAPAASTGRLPGTALAQLLACADLPVAEVESPPPAEADCVLLLRSTLPGGGARVSRWVDLDLRPIWVAADRGLADRLLARLAERRAQRSVSLA